MAAPGCKLQILVGRHSQSRSEPTVVRLISIMLDCVGNVPYYVIVASTNLVATRSPNILCWPYWLKLTPYTLSIHICNPLASTAAQ